MAISVASLAAASSDTDLSTYTTASIAPTAGRGWIAWVNGTHNTTDTDPPDPTVTGAGLTWTIRGRSTIYNTGAGARRRRLFLLHGAGTPSSGTLSIAWGVTFASCGWDIDEITGGDTTSPVVLSNIVTGGSGSGTALSGSLTLAAASDSNNRPISAWGMDSTAGITQRANWTEIADVNNTGASLETETQYRSDTYETAASAAFGATVHWGGIAAELAIASAVVVTPGRRSRGFG